MCEECENEVKEIKENKKQEKIRKVFLDDLPRKEGKGATKNKIAIDWINSIGYKVRFIYDSIKGEITILDYITKNKKYKLIVQYLDKEPFEIFVGHFQECKLGKYLGKHTDKFKIKIGQVFKDDKRDIVIIDKEYRTEYDKNNNKHKYKWYKYKCIKCGYDEGWMIEGSLLQGKGCVCCSGKIVVENINSIVAQPKTQWMISYFQGGYNEAKLYTPQSSQKLYFKCPDCGQIKNKLITINNLYNEKTISCVCGDGISYPNKFMFNMLDQLNIKFISEYSPVWCKFIFNNKNRKGRYDFYFELNDKKYIVEMDGEWHKVHNNISNQTTRESKYIDNEKDKLANKHEIEVVRIDCRKSDLKYIKNNIYNSKLNELFDLNKIDWLQIEKSIFRNRVIKACELKRENPNITTTEIGDIMNLSSVTIKTYLKKGATLGWCEYNPKEEMKKSAIKNSKNNRKAVEIFKDGVSLGTYKSGADLARQSEKLFGIKLSESTISLICLGKQKYSKGFTFKYVD